MLNANANHDSQDKEDKEHFKTNTGTRIGIQIRGIFDKFVRIFKSENPSGADAFLDLEKREAGKYRAASRVKKNVPFEERTGEEPVFFDRTKGYDCVIAVESGVNKSLDEDCAHVENQRQMRKDMFVKYLKTQINLLYSKRWRMSGQDQTVVGQYKAELDSDDFIPREVLKEIWKFVSAPSRDKWRITDRFAPGKESDAHWEDVIKWLDSEES